MLKLLISVECVLICAITCDCMPSKMTKSINGIFNRSQNSTSGENFGEVHSVGNYGDNLTNQTSRKMLDDITTKVWKVFPVVDVPRNWVLPYCMRYTEIWEEIQKATLQCQYETTDWDCVFRELGGGQDNFSMGKVVSFFHNISNEEMRLKLLRGAEVCGKFWRRYKHAQEERLIRLGLNTPVTKMRRKRLSKNKKPKSKSRVILKRLRKRKEKRDEKLKERRQAIKEIENIRHQLRRRVSELENKKVLNPEETLELDRLHLTVTTRSIRSNLEEESIIKERTELTRFREIGFCLSQQAMKACENVVLKAIERSM